MCYVKTDFVQDIDISFQRAGPLQALVVQYYFIFVMLLILDLSPEIGAHVWSNLCYLIYLRHLIRMKAVTNQIFFEIQIFIRAHILCYHLIQAPWGAEWEAKINHSLL